MPKVVRGVLLDVDGTLLDSNDAHARAWVEALAEAGFPVELARVRALIGKGGDKVLPELTGIPSEDPRGEAITKRRVAVFRERHLPSCAPLPGARALLERLRREGQRLVVATSASAEEVGELLEAAGVRDLVDHATTSSDAEASKPDPDIIQAAVARARLPREALVMLGDTPYDVEASRRAGVTVVALRSGGWGDADLAGAAAVYDDPAALLAAYETSPLAR